jgi:hypothetical protein
MSDETTVTTIIDRADLLPAGGAYIPLDVKRMRASADMDRVPYTMAEMVIGPVDVATWKLLSPNRPAGPTMVEWRIRQYIGDDPSVAVGFLPYRFDSTDRAQMVIRRAERDRMTGEITLFLSGPESLMDDKKRVAAIPVDTGATNVGDLVMWSLSDVFGGGTTFDLMPTDPIPAGDRRKMLPGESHNDLLEPELDAHNYRLWSDWGVGWSVSDREDPPLFPSAPVARTFATYTGVADADATVTGLTETLDRDSDQWADAVLVHGQYTDSAGGRQEWYQVPSGGGANTKAKVVQVERAAPSANLADVYTLRARLRAAAYRVTARNDFMLRPGMKARIYTPTGIVGGFGGFTVRSIEWDTDTGEMTFTGFSEGYLIS